LDAEAVEHRRPYGDRAMIAIPTPPEASVDHVGRATMSLRYEDVAQDGRMMLEAMPPALGEAVWRSSLARAAAAKLSREQGIVPILSRMIVVRSPDGGEAPISVNHSVEAQGLWQLAHTVDERGAVDRLILNLWVDLHGTIARTYGPRPERAGERVVVGRVFAEHVFTRLFAEPGARKVVAFDFPGMPRVPETRHEWRDPARLLDAPERATALDDALEEDATPIVFGLAHTDSNQHVNSLAYPRLFEEAVLRRLAARGRDTRTLSSAYEIAFRKPCFAGDVARVSLRAFADGDGVAAVGAFTSAAAGIARPHCWVRMRLD
jgi:hypothetical protein